MRRKSIPPLEVREEAWRMAVDGTVEAMNRARLDATHAVAVSLGPFNDVPLHRDRYRWAVICAMGERMTMPGGGASRPVSVERGTARTHRGAEFASRRRAAIHTGYARGLYPYGKALRAISTRAAFVALLFCAGSVGVSLGQALPNAWWLWWAVAGIALALCLSIGGIDRFVRRRHAAAREDWEERNPGRDWHQV